MCGIIGYLGNQDTKNILLNGLKKLEYRGYDSIGIATITASQELSITKTSGKFPTLKKAIVDHPTDNLYGIGHTRWATHGKPSKTNSHPHSDCTQKIAVVHNGIIENYRELREELIISGHNIVSETDSECIPHMIEDYIAKGHSISQATQLTASRLEGSNAVVVSYITEDPVKLIAFKSGNAGGVVIGYTKNATFIASDITPLIEHTSQFTYLNSGEIAYISENNVEFKSLKTSDVLQKEKVILQVDNKSTQKGTYKHYMLKEIHEQPQSIVNTMKDRLFTTPTKIDLSDCNLDISRLKNIERIILIGMGSSLHAAMVGKIWLEQFTGIPVDIDNASEFRYRNPVINEKTLVISVCQSGETADTLGAMEIAKAKNAYQITLTNYLETQSTRLANSYIHLRTGTEIGVASTKTFLSSMAALFILGLFLGNERKTIPNINLNQTILSLNQIPEKLNQLLSQESLYTPLAKTLSKYRNFLILGRGLNYPIGMEGALKLKEISYIHAEGYPAGELKHGPISLIDQNIPIIAIAPQDSLYPKMMTTISEIAARNGNIIVLTTEGNTEIKNFADHIIYLPEIDELLTPFLTAVPLQLLAYYVGISKGYNVDQPRHLAKSVTVE